MRDKASRTFAERVPGLFDPSLLSDLRAHLDAGCAGWEEEARTDRERRAVARGESPDAVRLDPRWYDVWRRPPRALLEAIRPMTWVVFPVQVRRVRAGAHFVPWHQDVAYQKLLGARGHRRHITCFLPLEPEPRLASTIQFATRAFPELPHEAPGGFGAGLDGIDIDDVEHHELALGDALLFGDLVLHRTYTPPSASVERRSLEFRLVTPEDALAFKDYFDVESGWFVRTDGSRREAP